MEYEPVIGFETHIQTKTKSKMFCGCATGYFQDPPNSHTCPVCLGMPGAMPVPNQAAIEMAIKIALALNCKINNETKFDRKNYFYPDLPKGFQISQYDQPIGEKGSIIVDNKDGESKIRITRVHQEEDTAKSIHTSAGTMIDFNKSGVPLVEVVTEPDFRSVEEVTSYAKRLRQIVRYLGVSDADMEKGQMRFELNMSLREKGTTELPNYKVEVKNIGSISVLEKVVRSEFKRQSELLDNGETPAKETRGLKDMTGETLSQRSKESEADYRYFPEPDIPLIELDNKYIEKLKAELPELPYEKKQRYIKDFSLEKDSAEVIISTPKRVKFFESALDGLKDKKLSNIVAKWFVGEYLKLANSVEVRSADFKPEYISQIVELVETKRITSSVAKEVLKESFNTGKAPVDIVETKGLETVSDTGQLDKVVAEVISENPKAVEDVKKNPNSIMFLVGQVMKKMQGKADATTVRGLLEKACK